MKKYIVSFLVASIFLAGAPFAVKQASASDLSIRDFVNLLIIIGVIPADKVPAVNAYLATLDKTTPPIVPPVVNQPSIRVISPNGGENLKFGDSLDISWSTTGISNGRVGVYLMNTNNLACSIGSAEATAGSYTITLTENQVCPGNPYFTALEAGRYKVYIDAAPATGLEGIGDSSDGYFTITAPIISEPSITSPNGGERIVQGQMLNVFWNSASPTQAVGISIVSSTGGIMQNFVQGVTPAGADYQSLGFTTSASTSSNRYIPVGQYKASVCSVASHQCNNSDNYFSIVAATN
jgi:hypothetical protein